MCNQMLIETCCNFGKFELVNGLFIGILSSVLATIIVLTIQYLHRKSVFKKKFLILEGEYEGYGYSDSYPTKLNTNESQSNASIKYIERNKLKIYVKHDERKWTGDLIMESENFGTIVWKYDSEKADEHNFGFKRCYVWKDNDANKLFLYLIGESQLDGTYNGLLEGDNKELLKRILKSNREVFIKSALF